MLADDHAVVRSGLRAELGDAFDVVGEADDAEGAIDVVDARRPDLVVCDLHMPRGGGLLVVERCATICPIVILTVSEAERDLLDAVAAGAAGYLLKTASTEELRDTLVAAAAGEPVFSPSLAALVLGEFRRMAAPRGRTPSLIESAPCCNSWPAATGTPRSAASWGSHRRRPRTTSATSSASSTSAAAPTSSATPSSTASTDWDHPRRRGEFPGWRRRAARRTITDMTWPAPTSAARPAPTPPRRGDERRGTAGPVAAWLAATGGALVLVASIVVVAGNWQDIEPWASSPGCC